jgi:hypothetical protein
MMLWEGRGAGEELFFMLEGGGLGAEILSNRICQKEVMLNSIDWCTQVICIIMKIEYYQHLLFTHLS